MRSFCCILFIFAAAVCWGADRRDLPVVYDAFSGDIAKSDVWDVTRLGVRSTRGDVAVMIGESGTYSEYFGNMVFHYLLKGDSVLYRGYTCGRFEGLINDYMTIAWKRPLEVGTRLATFTQRGMRDNIRMETTTRFESEAVGRGRFVLSVADTLHNVFLIREKHSVSECLADSRISLNDYTLEFHRWFAGNDSVPFAVQFSLSGDKFAESALYVSEYAVAAEEDETPDNSDIRAVLSGAVVTHTGSDIEISFPAASESDIEVWLVDSSGHSYGHGRHSIGDTGSLARVSVAGLPRGAYMLVISSVEEPSVTEKRMLTL